MKSAEGFDRRVSYFVTVSDICSDDPRAYQSCYNALDIVPGSNISEQFCSTLFTKTAGMATPTIFTLMVTLPDIPSDLTMPPDFIAEFTTCDGYCEDHGCLDEALCNGYRYGIFCKGIISNMTYVRTQQICDSILDCESGEDEMGCSEYNNHMIDLYAGRNGFFNITPIGNETINYGDYEENFHNQKLYGDVKKTKQCIPEWTGLSSISYRNLTNFTKCSPLATYEAGYYFNLMIILGISTKQIEDNPYAPYCKFYMDQTNCSDPMRGVVPCMIDGYPSTVSKFATCVQNPGLCDDGFDSLCLTTTLSCNVHKHLFCNGISDCSDKSDETSMICDRMTLATCSRRYRHDTKLHIPISWLMDGIEDCINGEDESEMWPTCGIGRLSRYVHDSNKCEDVYICSPRSYHFVTFQDLCNGYDICDHARVCGQTRSSEHVFTNPITTGIAKPLEFLMHCVPGLSKSLGHYKSQCVKEDFLPVSIFGLNGIPTIVLPKTMSDCINVYGRVYVYLSCLNKCKEQPVCPLRPLNYDSCMIDNQYKDRVFTLENKNRLTFLNKKKKSGRYQNDIFLCKNDKCVDYDKVCNLVDDCGDSSDEDTCINNFLCLSSKRFIGRSQKCDGKIDCTDYTDECNEDCKRTIISKLSLKVFSWVVGFAAVILNSIKLFKNLKHLVTRQFTSALNNKVLATVIHVGDLITGLYLLTIAILDSVVFAESYCKERFNWLSSDGCAFLGVFSTFGSQISLFSMTFLSIFRAIGIIKVQKMTSKYAAAKMMIIIAIMSIASFVLAYIPLMVRYEDIFVNGMTYNSKVKIFPAFVNKDTHIDKIIKYYGRIVGSVAYTWEKINNLINRMFSNQYGGIGRRKIHFYGNDGVCLFKYFVSREDPQKVYVWSNILLIFVCFIIILICYSNVLFFKKNSKQRARMRKYRDQNRRSRDKEETDSHIAIIIATDFFCWVPFMSVCALHYFELMDATALYPISSIVILPINSVINPILYHNYITLTVNLMVIKVRYWVSLFYMSYVRRCVLSIHKLGLTKRRKRDVERNADVTPQSALNANELSGQDEEIRPYNNNQTVNKEVPTVLSKNDGTLETTSKSDITKNNLTTLNETEIATEYSKIFLKKEIIPNKFIIMHRILRTIPEECELSQNKDLNPKNVFGVEKNKEKDSLQSKNPATKENGIDAMREVVTKQFVVFEQRGSTKDLSVAI